MEYRGLLGGRYDFNGWADGSKLSDLLDRQDYLSCLHGCALALSLVGTAEACRDSLVDDGIIRELIHLSSSIDMDTRGSIEFLRSQIVDLEQRVTEVIR